MYNPKNVRLMYNPKKSQTNILYNPKKSQTIMYNPKKFSFLFKAMLRSSFNLKIHNSLIIKTYLFFL